MKNGPKREKLNYLSLGGGGEQKGKNSKGKVDKRDLLHNNFMLEKQV